jgi:hypothetical protein
VNQAELPVVQDGNHISSLLATHTPSPDLRGTTAPDRISCAPPVQIDQQSGHRFAISDESLVALTSTSTKAESEGDECKHTRR